ncbi:MAG: hypothetical protein NEHIOOID_00979 [Holosporales bacterium]
MIKLKFKLIAVFCIFSIAFGAESEAILNPSRTMRIVQKEDRRSHLENLRLIRDQDLNALCDIFCEEKRIIQGILSAAKRAVSRELSAYEKETFRDSILVKCKELSINMQGPKFLETFWYNDHNSQNSLLSVHIIQFVLEHATEFACELSPVRDPFKLFSENNSTFSKTRISNTNVYPILVFSSGSVYTSYNKYKHLSKENKINYFYCFYDANGFVKSSSVVLDLDAPVSPGFRAYNLESGLLSTGCIFFNPLFFNAKPEDDVEPLAISLHQFFKKNYPYWDDLSYRRRNGETLFLPLPFNEKETDEAATAEDLFNARLLLTELSEEEKEIKRAEDAKKERYAERIRNIREELERINSQYQTKNETLIATLEGKLLSIREAEYLKCIEEEHNKIRNEFADRSRPHILRQSRIKAVRRVAREYALEMSDKKFLDQKDEIEETAKRQFLKEIENNHNNRRVVLQSYLECLERHGIEYREVRDGSHVTIHPDGARPVTVVIPHRGTPKLSGRVIRNMLQSLQQRLRVED